MGKFSSSESIMITCLGEAIFSTICYCFTLNFIVLFKRFSDFSMLYCSVSMNEVEHKYVAETRDTQEEENVESKIYQLPRIKNNPFLLRIS